MDLNQTNEPRFTDEEMAEVDRLQSDPTSEYYYNDPDESFLDKVMRKLEPYGEDFKGFIEYLFTPSRHFGTGQYNEGGVTKQMEMFGFTAEGAQQEADKFVKEAGDLEKDISKAASFVVPFYESGVNISNVVQEYMKPEKERDYEYIKSQFKDAGQSAAIEAGLLLMGGVAAKYGGKGIKALADKVKQVEVKTNPNTVSMLGMGSVTISKKPEKEMISVFPKPERMFPEDARPKGGDYLDPKTGDVLSGRNVSSASLKISPDGKPSFKVSNDDVETVGSTGKGKTQIKTNLFKKKAGWKWTNAPKDMEDIATLISVENKGKHFYTVETDFSKGVNLKKYPNSKTEPRLRPTVVGEIELGPQIGTISVRGKEHPVYSKVTTFNEGGVAMNEQMEMAFMQEGGIKDDGMTKDPVSGNPIPPGSMANEVRDDIPAMLSEGEYVVPADVLRFYGVNFFEDLRNKAKSGLQNMEKNGRIGGEPLSPQQIQQNMGQSGVTMQANQGGAVGYNPGGLQNQLDPYMQQAKQLGGGFDPSQFSTVGGTLFNQTGQFADSITRSETYVNAETGDTRIVQFVSSAGETKVVPPSDEIYTKPPYYVQGSSALKQAQQAFQQSQTGGGSDPKDPPETKPKQPFGIDVDWTNPKAYADSLLEGPDGLPKSIQMLSALAGPFGMAVAGGANAAMTLGKISDLRATQILATAQGDTATAEYIQGELDALVKRSPNIVSFLEEAVAPGTSKAKEVLDRLGLDYEEDKKGNITFTERMQELNNRRITASQFDKDKSGGVYKPGGIDVALGQGSSSDKDYNAAVAKSKAAAAARLAAMEEAQAAGGSSDDIADLKEKYEEAGGTWASGGRAEGGLMTKAKKKK